MIPRYSHPLVTELWSDVWTYNAWLMIERRVLDAQIRLGINSSQETDRLLRYLARTHIDDAAAGEIRAIERVTQHDVAAFLQWLRRPTVGIMPIPGNGKHIHYGLTSSDLVDTAQAMRFRQLHPEFLRLAQGLVSSVTRWTLDDTMVPGRTHGELAEPTSMRARAYHWSATLEHPIAAVLRANQTMCRAKLSGPVGTFAHNPPGIERDVALALDLEPQGSGSSQILPRSALALWASAISSFAAACSKIATDFRLLYMLNEVGLSAPSRGEVGSSSMAHKRNPIQAEQINGLARVAQGYASMLQPIDGWLERDISHSSVERIAVPDLWHVLFRVLTQTTDLLERMVVLNWGNGYDHPELWVHKMTLDTLDDAQTVDEARESALIGMSHGDLGGIPPEWFMRNYPNGGSER